ncbi:F0F1 ATP synthase subunit B [uncultured Flavonifractor sp.]|uniref:ATP synthase subunit b n=1 Tax=Candidatus Flavonifractor intestinigallinarum TaxID=2838586 RepID=A0A9D2SAD4_9FIRM|nr:F0F1 ATP synthase subunit B [uncultured Flavonifractor sp.]HJB79534.1 F0F1 ATP synthase subunit B [Candidatus Flavonifractor intestinigallinarum]
MLEFHLSTILFTIINLLVLFFLLKKFLFGRVNAVLEQRAALVKSEIASAEDNNRQAEALKAQYEGKLTDARHEAAKIVADAQNRAQRVYEGKMAEAEADAKRLRGEAEAQIAEQRDAMLRGARNEVASLALLAAAKVAQRSMDDADDRAFVDTFLSEVGEQV